jgi:hypothetical protein
MEGQGASMRFKHTFAGFVFLMMSTSALLGQFTTASLSGVVSDPSGAAVPDAKVLVRNTETGFQLAATTGESGLYLFPRLPIGSYTLRVEKGGFSAYVQEGISLTVNQSATQNVSLKVGQIAESVLVSANVELVTTGTATVSQLVDEKRVVELPLNGRRAQTLLYLAAGTVDEDQIRSLGYGGVYPGEQLANINGTGLGQVNYQLDGAGHNDTYLNLNLPFPNPDAIQEFSLQSDNLSSQFGNAAGGVVNIVTKSGTNEIHGGLFEFLRNGSLNARNFFAPVHDSLKRNQFGGSLGGPIKKDKLFYFGTFQGTRIRTAPEGQIAFVPTQAQRQGDFSSISTQLVDPLNGQPFAGNRIPEARLSTVARNLLSGIPLPTGPDQEVTYTGRSGDLNENQFMIKTDYNAGLHQLNVRYFFSDYNSLSSFSKENLLAASSNVNGVRVQNVAVNHTYTARPTLMVNSWFGWNQQRGGSIPNATFGFPDVGMVIATPDHPELDFSVDGYFSVNTSGSGDFDRGDWTLREDLSWIKGGHELHFGGEIVRVKNRLDNPWLQAGGFTFGNQLSGDNLADYMLGRASNFIQGGGEYKDMVGTRVGLFVQDHWRVSPRLTFNLGFRWDPHSPYRETKGRIVCFSPGAPKSVRYPNAPSGLAYGGDKPDQGCPQYGYDGDIANLAPRVGFAYRLTNDGKTSLRGGIGVYYTPFMSALVYMHVDPPFGPIYEFNDVSFDNPWNSIGISSPFPALYGSNIPGPDAQFVTPVSLYYMQRDLQIPQLTTWNLTLERQVGSWVIRAAYVGNKGTHISGSDDYNPAQEVNAAVYIPGSSTVANTQARRPFQEFSGVSEVGSNNNTKYHSGQLSLERRFSRGFSVLANYTWAKLLDDIGWTNPFNREFDYGRSRDDLGQNFKFSSIWEIPRTRLTGAAGSLINGWGLAANLSWHGGFPFNLRSGRDNSLSGVGRDRPDFIGTDIHQAELDRGRPHGELIGRFFDTSLFVQNAVGTYGNTGKNVLLGPRFFNTDLGVLKNTRITERTNLQFRAEFFNVFNNVNFKHPNVRLSAGSSFGRITSAFDPRIIQFALKLSF